MSRSQRKVFDALREVYPSPLTGPMLDQVAQRYGARLLELDRDFGVRWDKCYVKRGVYAYRLLTWPGAPEEKSPGPSEDIPVEAQTTNEGKVREQHIAPGQDLHLFDPPGRTTSAITGRAA